MTASDGTVLLKAGRVLDPASDHDAIADVRVRDGQVVEIGNDLKPDGEEVLDCAGLWVAPGFVDLHVHFREPGFEDAEDIETGSMAAAAGGYTAVCPMANTDPVCDTAAVAETVYRRAQQVGLVDVHPVGAITKGLEGRELSEMGELVASAARVRMFSDDGIPVSDALIMRRALMYAARFDAVICNHSEDPDLTIDAQMNEGEMSSILGLAGWPHEAEEIMIARDLILAEGTGTRLHIPHISTKGSVELLRAAKARGIRVTAEATPHHLSLADTNVSTYDPVFKVNPPLRSAEDIAAVRAALADGTIDCVATDHAPHAPQTKDQEWDHAPCGMLGLETAFAVLVDEMVDVASGGGAEDGITLLTAVDRMTRGPAAVLGFDDQGGIAVGAPANLTVIDPEAGWTVDGHRLRSRSRNTPFEGRRLATRPVHTLLRGRFTLRDGQVCS